MTADGVLRVHVQPEGLPPGAVLAGEVLHARTGRGRPMPLVAGETRETALAPGTYLVRAELPSGDLVDRVVDIAEGAPAAVSLDTGTVVKSSGAEPAVRVWARLWRGSRIEPLPIAADEAWAAAAQHRVEIRVRRDAYLLQLGGDDTAWRFVCLPPGPRCQVTITRVRAAGDLDEGVQVRAWDDDETARAMLTYLSAGRLEQARAVSGDLVDRAVGNLRDEFADPRGAAISGYLLLRLHQIARVRSWPETFVRFFGWLPDAQIILAGKLLAQPGVPARDRARECLLTAARSGPPRYTEGLRLLQEGLRMFAGSRPDDREVTEALATVRAYASACDWSAPQTTFWGAEPDRPSLTRTVGRPDSGPLTDFIVGR